MRLGKGAANDGKILGGDGNLAAIDPAQAHHHRVPRKPLLVQAKGRMAMGDVGSDFLEAARIEQLVYPLPGGELALGVLPVDRLGTTTPPEHLAPTQQVLVQIVSVHSLLLQRSVGRREYTTTLTGCPFCGIMAATCRRSE
jgi:hypothetical protein